MVVALKTGDRGEVLRAAVIYANHLATRGGVADPHERAVQAVISGLCKEAGEADVAYARGTAGCGLFLRGRWREAADSIDGAYANLQGRVAGWQAQAGLYALYSFAFLGDLGELRTRSTRQLEDADQRGDLFTSVQIRASHPVVLLLAADDPAAASRQTREANAQWPSTKFLTQHWQIMRSEAEIELYAGEGAKSYERLRQDERALKRSMLQNVQFIRCLTAFVRGRAAVASIAPNDAAQRAARLTEAQKLARQLAAEKMTWTAPLESMVAAAASNAGGQRAEALASLERAATEADAAQMSLYAAAARYQRGVALGGIAGAELQRAAEEVFHAQEIKAPARFAAMYVPGRWD
jgi:exonuclease VII small subunit